MIFLLFGVKLLDEKEVEAYFQRRVKIFNIFSIISLILTVVGFIVFLLGYLLEWNMWIHTSIGGSIILIAVLLPLIVRFALRVRDPELKMYIATEADMEKSRNQNQKND